MRRQVPFEAGDAMSLPRQLPSLLLVTALVLLAGSAAAFPPKLQRPPLPGVVQETLRHVPHPEEALSPFVEMSMGSKKCDASSTGAGWETAACIFSCDRGSYVNVHASVDDNGVINGDAACGGSYTSCSGHGSCGRYGTTPTRYASSSGTCEARGDGGWWTRVTVACTVTTVGSSEASAEAWIILDHGVVHGYACRAGACVAATPTCIVDERGWSCGLGDLARS